MELKWKEQVKIAENAKLELAEVQENYRVSFVFMEMCYLIFINEMYISNSCLGPHLVVPM